MPISAVAADKIPASPEEPEAKAPADKEAAKAPDHEGAIARAFKIPGRIKPTSEQLQKVAKLRERFEAKLGSAYESFDAAKELGDRTQVTDATDEIVDLKRTIRHQMQAIFPNPSSSSRPAPPESLGGSGNANRQSRKAGTRSHDALPSSAARQSVTPGGSSGGWANNVGGYGGSSDDWANNVGGYGGSSGGWANNVGGYGGSSSDWANNVGGYGGRAGATNVGGYASQSGGKAAGGGKSASSGKSGGGGASGKSGGSSKGGGKGGNGKDQKKKGK